jgi:hypothetical protein
MSCPSDTFQPDFFNNAAAIAVVLLFTKVVAHRSRKGPPSRWAEGLHVIAVIGAAVATGAALWATHECSTYRVLDDAVWGGLAAAGIALLIDILCEDVSWKRLSRLVPRQPIDSTDEPS